MKPISNMLKFFTDEKSRAWLLVAPCLCGCGVFILIPVVCSFALGFFEWDLLTAPKFVGLDNYFEIFNEPEFLKVLLNTFLFAVANTVFAVAIPVVLADMLNQKLKMSELFKTVYFLPFITPMIVAALIWNWIFDPNIGFMNYLLKTHIEWLYDTHTALFAVTLVSVWKLIGYNTVLVLSGYAGINSSLTEAAQTDGASKFQIFTKITLPLLSPVIFFVLTITTVSSFQVFDLIYLMTKGGPESSTDVLVYWLYKNAFEYFEIGHASAAAYVLFVIIAALTAIQWMIRKKWVFGE